jgi:DNA-binding transcriptional regulator YiaG
MASGLGQPCGRDVAATANEVVRVRGKLGLSQTKFANLLGISENTLQNWEQGRRQPTGLSLG